MFCCINFSGLGACVSRAALSGKRSKGHDLYQKTTAVDRRTLDALNIEPKSIERLHEVFVQIDRDGSGEISLSEFFRFFSHKRRFPNKSKFSKRVFSIMDADGSGELSFVEFVVALWNFCTFTKPALLRFSFELYDDDDSGYLDPEEIRLILREVYGKHQYKSSKAAMQVLRDCEIMIEKQPGAGLNLQMFNEFCRHHPALLYPAFELQQALQQNVLGAQFWDVASKKRRSEKKKLDKKNGNGAARFRRRGKKEQISMEDMSYKELARYLETYGKGIEEEKNLDKEWWEVDGDASLAGAQQQLRRVDLVEEERAAELEIKLRAASAGNASIRKGGSSTKYQVQMPESTTTRSTVLTISRIATAKKLAKKMKKNHQLRNSKILEVTTGLNQRDDEGLEVEVKSPITPWTCSTCQRMNTATEVCKTCQRKK